MRLLIKVGNLKYKTMSSDCLTCRKNTESIIPRVPKTNNGNHQNVQYMVLRNQDLLTKQ